MIRWILLLCLTVALIGADRYTKLSMMRRPDDGSALSSFTWITTTHHQNFGVLADQRIPMTIILVATIVVIALVVTGLINAMHTNRFRAALALNVILAGAIGNLWDRLEWKYVFDWILIGNTSIINIADICIAIGAGWYLIELWREWKRGHVDHPASS